ncbi:unnamed protein product (macronuclear) [Paramecium tetraurelia]|uniref:Uncharacterized protein n=1 Tax=Paramecium tetraurelia TaxID=5888 RepID=A0E7A4_PARTE|nr:uncharacterized protein GSPATT00023899001 [Paramecium tetraurelia]CAK91171.1 unnamed protein product [Paramecium tetraurelia]|eukprot:XP_001458568.1 hypothetical protein (macronuclear) [Paramecium tetraurelia strain d4-2]
MQQNSSQTAIQTQQSKSFVRESKYVTKVDAKLVEIPDNDEFEKIVEFGKEREYGLCIIQ